MTRRLLNYLRYSPCSLIYGLFRTAAVQRALPMLKENARPCQRSVFGGDLVFLAGFVKDHDWVHAPDTLLLLRGGGESHRPDVFRNLGHLMRELWVFHRRLRAVTGVCGWRNRITVGWARLRLFVRHLLGPPLLRLFHYHIIRVIPLLRPIVSSFTLWRNPAIRGLRHRARQLEAGTKIAIVGAGKHTQRNFGVIRRALGRRVQIAAIVDDRAKRISPIHGIAVISPEQLLTVHADILLVSSDAYERSLSQRASEIAAPRQQIWCIYDLANENCADRRVVENPHAMTLAA